MTAMTMTGRSVAVGLFDDRERARQAIEALKDAGFRGDDISLLMPDRGEARDLAEETGTKAGAGAATGAVTGGILGGIGGFLVGIVALAIPGVGPFIAAGALATTLGGAAVGAGVGAIAGALIGMGIPEEEAKYYEQEVRGGRTLVAVRADGRVDEADDLLHRYGAYDVQHRDRTPTGAGTTSAAGVMDSDRSRLAEAGTAGATAGMPAASAERWEDEAPHYRSRWQERFGTTGGRWEEYEPAYRYGWEMRSRPDYRDRRWDEVEPDLRRDWETRHREMPWDRVRDAIRDTWETRTGAGRMEAAEARGSDLAGGRALELREEELRAERRPVETGQVTVGKEVVEQQRTMEVPVTREEVTVEQHPVERRPADRPIEASSQTVEVPVREERVEVSKQPVVYEEVGVGKQQVQETRQVSDTVRREEVRVEQEGGLEIRKERDA
jgi:uncharacterized protein (TIGR02271 family)